MSNTKIEWTDRTWNPITGCSKISQGCQNCYAETMSKRLKAMGNSKYSDGFNVALHEDALNEPLTWKGNHIVFVCSMSDLFHENVPFEFIDKVLDVITKTPNNIYQLLTKRSKRMNEYFSTRVIPSNVWLGVTVEAKSSIPRIDDLRHLKASVKFLSCEPLIEDLGIIDLTGINWIIVGGESGLKARPMSEQWALNLLKQAQSLHIYFFFKQWGTWGSDGIRRSKKANGKLLNNKIFQEMPIANN